MLRELERKVGKVQCDQQSKHLTELLPLLRDHSGRCSNGATMASTKGEGWRTEKAVGQKPGVCLLTYPTLGPDAAYSQSRMVTSGF